MSAAEWPEPVLFDAPSHVPDFPLEALSPSIADFCGRVAESRQVSADLPALIALGVLAAAAARRFVVRLKDDYSEPLNLFIAPALEPGERKSAVFRDCLEPLAEAERELQAREAPRLAEAREQRNLDEARLECLRKQAAKAKAKERTELEAQARDLAVHLTKVPVEPRLIVGDVTPEKLASILVDQGGRIALADAEAGGVFEILGGRYSGNSRPNFDVFLRGHAGDDLRVDRMGRTENVRYPALTVILAPQPAVLRDLANQPQFRGRGLLARFLYALPQSLVGSRVFVQAAVPAETAARYRQTVRRIIEVDPPESGKPGHDLRLSPEALDIWRRCHDEIERRQGEGQDLRGIRDWASKAPGAAARIAGLLHLADGLRDETAILGETMTAACSIVREYLVPHALEAFAMLATDRNVGQARKIANWIARTNRERLTIRDAHKNFPGFGEPADFGPPFRVLENRGILRAISAGEQTGAGRKPSLAYEVNPRFLDLSAQSAESIVRLNFVYSADPSGGPEEVAPRGQRPRLEREPA